ncbi:gamma-glutamyl-gamma-aminobutyrate hydrolase family protein [Micrococcus sp. TA1]|uniref:gamma-glutamyl-gamma-aminobutyrate hydrolase family protein n=1 Tax=Micrococcus sp. TA1 TaxID=681627 RepID=UPI001616659B|nr:gamma-glutamyl-gamma-aminobutyrate hydrolase family protein [Micrococcus sp. TA1]MBB5750580.1 putative glutamine amidotransferase [Micrococcus sp. TA1]
MSGQVHPDEARPPLIAVPAMWSDQIRGLRFSGSVVANAVLEAIVRAGGEPVLVFPGRAFSRWDLIDGLVLPGGSDIQPGRYGQPAAEGLTLTDFRGQDDADARAIAWAEQSGVPSLLICRGMQLWNVERGGTLVQHWPAEALQHTGTVHDIVADPASRLGTALGGASGVDVSSYHHQAVDRIGDGLEVVARAPDGCVEALEDRSLEIVAVQWHPEDRAQTVHTDQALFDWVVEAARNRRDARAIPGHARGAAPTPYRQHQSTRPLRPRRQEDPVA